MSQAEDSEQAGFSLEALLNYFEAQEPRAPIDPDLAFAEARAEMVARLSVNEIRPADLVDRISGVYTYLRKSEVRLAALLRALRATAVEQGAGTVHAPTGVVSVPRDGVGGKSTIEVNANALINLLDGALSCLTVTYGQMNNFGRVHQGVVAEAEASAKAEVERLFTPARGGQKLAAEG